MNTHDKTEYIDLSFPSDLAYESIARDTVAAFIQALRFDETQIDNIKTALGEAYINAIEHGNLLAFHLRIRIFCSYHNGTLRVEVHDEGVKRFAPKEKPLTIEEKMAGMGPMRGLGLMLMEQLADEASYETNDEGGNCFRLTWHQR